MNENTERLKLGTKGKRKSKDKTKNQEGEIDGRKKMVSGKRKYMWR